MLEQQDPLGLILFRSFSFLPSLPSLPPRQVAALNRNRVEWAVSCMASLSLGATWVPMYEQQRLNECEYILKDSSAKLLLVGSEDTYDKMRHFLASNSASSTRSSAGREEGRWCTVKAKNHKHGKSRPQSLIGTPVDCYFLHFWYQECVCIGRVCEEDDAERVLPSFC